MMFTLSRLVWFACVVPSVLYFDMLVAVRREWPWVLTSRR